jgi:hypothetical protein
MRHDALLVGLLTRELDRLLWGENWREGGSITGDRSSAEPLRSVPGRQPEPGVESSPSCPQPQVKSA